jgi:hypothetical protein
VCVENGGRWVQSLSQNFDGIGRAMLTLIEISTTEGWADVMYAAADVRGPMLEPKPNVGEGWAWFFVFLASM